MAEGPRDALRHVEIFSNAARICAGNRIGNGYSNGCVAVKVTRGISLRSLTPVN